MAGKEDKYFVESKNFNESLQKILLINFTPLHLLFIFNNEIYFYVRHHFCDSRISIANECSLDWKLDESRFRHLSEA
jgi:hypothetical protein